MYPNIAIDYAIGRLKSRHEQRSFNYFLGIVKSFTAQKQPIRKNTASKKEEHTQKEDQSGLRFSESPQQKERWAFVLCRSQARIKAKHAGLEAGSPEYNEFVTSLLMLDKLNV